MMYEPPRNNTTFDIGDNVRSFEVNIEPPKRTRVNPLNHNNSFNKGKENTIVASNNRPIEIRQHQRFEGVKPVYQ